MLIPRSLILFLFLVVPFFQGTSALGEDTNAPIIQVYIAPWIKNPDGSYTPPHFKIPECAGVILDMTNYTFVPPEGLAIKEPNLIHVTSPDLMYRSVFSLPLQPGKQHYELSPTTLLQGRSPEPFHGFKKDFVYLIQIGHAQPDETFTPYWAGVVEVH
jgi:hypothetical protein